MAKHMWVAITMTPLVVEESTTVPGGLDVYVEAESAEAAEEDTQLNCWFCHTPLTPAVYDNECEYEQPDSGY